MIQLDILAQIEALLRADGIKFWLRGGWAIDFLLGNLTRSHSDIDLVAWQGDAPRIRGLFEEAGFLFIRDTGVQIDFLKSGQEICVVLIVRKGEEVSVENIPEWNWLPDALTFPPQQLNGLSCNVLSPQQLLEEKEGYEKGTGRPLRPKDLQSIAVLRQIVLGNFK